MCLTATPTRQPFYSSSYTEVSERFHALQLEPETFPIALANQQRSVGTDGADPVGKLVDVRGTAEQGALNSRSLQHRSPGVRSTAVIDRLPVEP